MTIHRDHDVVTANILLSPKRSTDNANTEEDAPQKKKTKAFSGGGCFIYSAAELSDIDEENISVRCELFVMLFARLQQAGGCLT